MCIAWPMTVVSVEDCVARVTRPSADKNNDACNVIQTVDTIGVDPLRPGDHVLVFRGAVLRKVDSPEAQRIEAALACVAAVMAGDQPDHATFQKAFNESSPLTTSITTRAQNNGPVAQGKATEPLKC